MTNGIACRNMCGPFIQYAEILLYLNASKLNVILIFRYHYIILLLAFMSFSDGANSQTEVIDNLLEKLETEDDIEIQIQIHSDLCWEYRPYDNALSIKHGKAALKLAQKEQLHLATVKALRYLGLSSPPDTALSYFIQSAEVVEKYGLKSEQAVLAYNSLGNGYSSRGQYEKAIAQFNKAISLAESLNDPDLMAFLNIGLVHVLYDLEEYDECILLANKSIQMIESNITNDLGILCCIAGGAYTRTGVYDSAEVYLKKSLEIHQQTGDLIWLGNATNNLGVLYSELENPEASLSYYRKSLAIEKLYPNKESIGATYVNIAGVHSALGQWDSSVYYMEIAVDLNERYARFSDLMDSRYFLSRALYMNKEYQRAYDNLSEYHKIKDSILSEENKINTLKLQQQFENERRINEYKLLQSENEQIRSSLKLSNTWLFGSIAISILVLVLIYLFYKNKRIRDDKIRMELEKSVLDLKSTALMAQLNPHLVFNILNSIQGLVASNEREKANIYISKFSMFMRKCIELSEVSSVPIHEELQLLSEYFDLEKLRFEDQITLNIQSPTESNVMVPPLILQPLVENSIKHGLHRNKGEQGVIEITISDKDKFTEILVKDNGKGFPKDIQINSGHGIGISLQRLKTLNTKNHIEISQYKYPSTLKLTIHK